MVMANSMGRLLLAASLLVSGVSSYKAKVFGPMIEEAIATGKLQVGGTNQTTPGSIPQGINFNALNSSAKVTSLPAEFFLDRGSQRAKLAFGPFAVQGMQEGNGMIDYIQVPATMPCSNCTITYIQAGLEYPDGSYANANTSLWLHHTVLIKIGTEDTVCGFNYYGRGQRWFASGNERTPASLCVDGAVPAGYYLGENESHLMLLELMNQAMVYQEAVLTFIFEWVPGFPQDFYSINPVWLDIAGCPGDSDMPALTDTSFSYDSPVYNSNFSGALIGTGAHLHDGGVYADIVKNDTIQCQSIAFYGQTQGYWDQAGVPMSMDPETMDAQMSMGPMRMPHISSMGYCLAPNAMIEVNDVWQVNAYYNFTEFAPMLNSDGSEADVMGISLLYVAENMTMATLESFVGSAPQNPYPNGTYYPHLTALSPDAPMTCVWMRDSPGDFTSAGLNFTDYDSQMLYLMAILDDACLQVRSRVYALDFGYAIVGAIILFALVQRGQKLALLSRKRSATNNGAESVWKSNGISSRVTGPFRAITYRQITPTKIPRIFKLPNFGIALAIIGYLALVVLMSLIHADTGDDQRWQSMSVQATWVSMAQLPLIIALANKKNFVGMFTGITYERLNILHRWTARGLLLSASLHFGLASHGWNRLGLMQLEWATDTCPPTGIAAYALLLWINLSTLAPFRNFSYEFFVVQHIITFIGFIVAVMYHIPTTALSARYYVYTGIVLYFASRLIQTLMFVYRNIRPSRATITAVSPSVTKITLANRSLTSWSPGSHILIRFPSLGFWQSHPATIASTPESHNGELIFFMRAHKGFSKTLHKAALNSSPIDTRIVLLDGPYGGLQPDFAAFHTTILIASSTGITFTLPILLDLAERASHKVVMPIRRIEFFWTIRDGAFTQAVRSELMGAISQLRAEGIAIAVNIHVTGKLDESAFTTDKGAQSGNSSSETSSLQDASDKEKSVPRIKVTRSSSWDHDIIPVTKGRCDVPSMLRRVRGEAEGEVGVAVCGSLELTSAVRNHAQQGAKGTFLHVEGFGW